MIVSVICHLPKRVLGSGRYNVGRIESSQYIFKIQTILPVSIQKGQVGVRIKAATVLRPQAQPR
jgi:hypothetical protein